MICRFCKREIFDYDAGDVSYGTVHPYFDSNGFKRMFTCDSNDGGINGCGDHVPMTEAEMVKEILSHYDV